MLGFRAGRRVGLWLALVALGVVVPGLVAVRSAGAQYPRGGGLLGPRLTPQGEWAEVLSVTPKWMVLQNARGQQFPVALAQDTIGLFVMRWPIAPASISPRAVVEVTGVDIGTNAVRANHLDVFEPDAQGMLNGVWPSVTHVVGLNRIATPYSVDRDDAYNGYSMVYPLPIEQRMPNRTHAVAPVIGVNPIRLAIGNNNALTVLPLGPGLNMTQVTAGSASFVQPGDLAYVLVTGRGPKSLTLSELVVYKRIPLSQFAP